MELLVAFNIVCITFLTIPLNPKHGLTNTTPLLSAGPAATRHTAGGAIPGTFGVPALGAIAHM